MSTTIKVSQELLEALKKRKLHSKESYEDIIWDLLEDQMVLRDEVVEQVEIGRKEYLKGEFETMEEVFGSQDEN